MGIDEAGLCYWCLIRIHQWVPPFVSFDLPRERLNKRPKLLAHICLLLRETSNGSAKIFRFIAKVVLRPIWRKTRAAFLNTILRRLQKGIQSCITFWSYQKEALFETPHFPNKYLKHLLGLTERNPIRTSLYGKNGKDDILGNGNSEIVTHQFEGPHKGIRVGVDLRRRQFSPAEHLPLEVREREPKTHVFENHFIHGKDVISVL